ncbi:hypothetical protein SME36J_46270 [Serratia marcescens]|nr:hypothetical protein SME36J_46270 [Serratia marcescens]
MLLEVILYILVLVYEDNVGGRFFGSVLIKIGIPSPFICPILEFHRRNFIAFEGVGKRAARESLSYVMVFKRNFMFILALDKHFLDKFPLVIFT